MGSDMEISVQEVYYKRFLGSTGDGRGGEGSRIRQRKKLGQAQGELWS